MAKLVQLKKGNENVYPVISLDKISEIFCNRGGVPDDWQTITKSGIYSCSNWRPNIPYSHSYYGILLAFNRYATSNSYLAVIYIDANANVFTNMRWNNVEQGWKQLNNV